MATKTKPAKPAGQLVKFNLTDVAIAKMSEEYLPLKIKGLADPGGLASVHTARMDVKNMRVEIEHTRKGLKADALRFGKEVDTEAKRLTSLLAPIEAHLMEEEEKVLKEKRRIKAEKEEAKRVALQSRLDALHDVGCRVQIADVEMMTDEEFDRYYKIVEADYEIEQERLATEKKEDEERKAEEDKAREEEEARLEKERGEQERIAEEQAKKDAAILKAARKVSADRLKLEEEKRLEAEKKQAAEDARIEERKRIERETKEKADAERRAEKERARLAGLRPDQEKLKAYVQALLEVPIPKVRKKISKKVLENIRQSLEGVVGVIRETIAQM